MLIKMNYIANNKEINTALKKFYNREISALEIGDIYFKYRLYSAASSFYNIELFDILNTKQYERKSYCFQKMGECYLSQQLDGNFSDWQLEMINELFTEAITFNQYNYIAYLGLITCLELQNRSKEVYHYCNRLLLHINEFNIKPEDYARIYKLSLKFYDLSEYFFIIKYDYFNNTLLKFFLDINYNTKKICVLANRIQKHIAIDKYENDIIKGNIYS